MTSKHDQNHCEIRLYFRLGEDEAELQKVNILLKELLGTHKSALTRKETKRGKQRKPQ